MLKSISCIQNAKHFCTRKVWKNFLYCWKYIKTSLQCFIQIFRIYADSYFLGFNDHRQLKTQGVGSLTGVKMFIFCNLFQLLTMLLMQWALFWVDVLRVLLFHHALSSISLQADPHLQKYLNIRRLKCFLLRGVVDSCLTSRMFSFLQFRSSMCCSYLFLMSGMQPY